LEFLGIFIFGAPHLGQTLESLGILVPHIGQILASFIGFTRSHLPQRVQGYSLCDVANENDNA
jgi:hypothetical protein